MEKLMGLRSLVLLATVQFCQCGVFIQPGSGYTRWPNKVIPVKTNGISNAYPEYPVLLSAMDQINSDLGYCVNLTLHNPSLHANMAHLVIQNKFANPATTSDICWTYPGFAPAAGINGQVVIMFGSASGNTAGGCLDNKRDAMRVLSNAMGLREEYRRSDRDATMTFPTSRDRNSLVAPILQKYNIFSPSSQFNATVASNFGQFDTNSITMVTGTRFAGTSQPVFSLAPGRQVGLLARLSEGDCNTLKLLYQCDARGTGPTPTCIDPYSAGSVTLTPSPAVIQRTIRCAATAGQAQTNGADAAIASFPVNGINCDATSALPTPTVTPAVSGLRAQVKKYASPLSVTNQVLTAYGGTGACQLVLEFTYNEVPAQGLTNQQLTVNFRQNLPADTDVGTVAVMLNLNCAPHFETVTVFQVGQAPVLANPVTKTLGGSSPNNIQQVIDPAATSASSVSLAAAALAPYMIQYYAEFGVPGALLAPAGTAVNPPVTKVFVNCVGTPASGIGTPGGTNVIGSVTAMDPEGGPVSYYVWSGFLTAPNVGSEIWSVTEDGILTATGLANHQASAAGTATSPTDVNGAPASPTLVADTGREVYISAVDSQGGQSVLKVRLFMNCGPVS